MRYLVVWIGLVWSLSASAFVSEWIPFQHERGHITIPVTLNGEPTTAILDTGATGNGISEAFLARHEGDYAIGKTIVVRGVYGERRVRLVDDVQIGMFGANFKIDQLMPMRIRSFDLLIGLPFFEKFIVQMDYPNSRLRLIGHESLKLRGVANVKMKRERGTGHPLVRVDLNGEYKPWVLFDTGNSAGMLLKRFDAERFGWLEKYPSVEARSVGVNAVVSENARFNLPMMKIGPFTLENVIITVPEEGLRANIGNDSLVGGNRELNQTNADGILGYDVLRHFVVTIDFKRSLLHLEPPTPDTATAAP